MNRILKHLLVAESFWLLAAGLFGPIYAIFVTEIKGDVLEAGGAYAAFSLAAAAMIFMISRWEDHVRHKERLIIIGHSIGAVAILGYLFVANPLQLFAVQAMLGVAGAIAVPAFDGIYSKNLDRGRFVSEWGLFDSMKYLVAGISAVVGGLIVSLYNFQTLCIILIIIAEHHL